MLESCRNRRVNAAHNAVPVLSMARFTVPVHTHCYHLDFIPNTHEDLHCGIRACWLTAVHFRQKLPEVAMLSRVGLLPISTKAQELAKPTCVGATLVVLGFQHEPCHPLPPLPRPGVSRFRALCAVFAGIQQRVGFAERDSREPVHTSSFSVPHKQSQGKGPDVRNDIRDNGFASKRRKY